MPLNSNPGPRVKPAVQTVQPVQTRPQPPVSTVNDRNFAPVKSLSQEQLAELKKIRDPSRRIQTSRWPGPSSSQDLTTASGTPVLVSGNGNTITLQASSSGVLSIQLEQDNAPLIDLLPGQSIRQRDFSRFYVSWSAQPGGSASLLVETLAPGQEIV